MSDKIHSLITEIATDGAETALNLLVDSDLIQALSVFGIVAKTINVVVSVKEQIFLKKIKSFLNGVSQVDPQLLKDFGERLESSSEKQRFGERLIILIEQSDEIHKAGILGVLFQRLLKREISEDDFDQLAFCVARIYLFDLYNFSHSLENSNILDKSLGASFAAHRLVDSNLQKTHNAKANTIVVVDIGYTMNVFGRKLAEAIQQYTKKASS